MTSKAISNPSQDDGAVNRKAISPGNRSERIERLPREMTPAMWGAGHTAFEKYASRYRDARTTTHAIVIADMAPQEIWEAIYDAATAPKQVADSSGRAEEEK